jgi:hypothetical protein
MTSSNAWPRIAFDAWSLSFDAMTVIGLRAMRLASGGAVADRESERMVAEKIFALWMLPLAMVSPMPTLDPAVAAQRSLAHFGKTVRSNRRRLSR